MAVAGCNDCHTPGYEIHGLAVPDSLWLIGTSIGFRGPWGTSYPKNLRLTVAAMTEDQWVERLTLAQGLPPMPWPNVQHMADADKRAIYRFIRTLGLAGEPMPEPVPPGVEPSTPYYLFDPTPPASGG